MAASGGSRRSRCSSGSRTPSASAGAASTKRRQPERRSASRQAVDGSFHPDVIDAGLVEYAPHHSIAEPLVERHGGDLRVAPDFRQPALARRLVKMLHDRPAYTLPPRGREHRDAADLSVFLGVEPAGADRLTLDECEDVNAFGIALVHLEVSRHALLVDEDGEANTANRSLVDGEIGFPDSNGRHRGRPWKRNCRQSNSPLDG